MGFEPMTFRTTIWRSNQLNYSHHVCLLSESDAKVTLFVKPAKGLRDFLQLSHKKSGKGGRRKHGTKQQKNAEQHRQPPASTGFMLCHLTSFFCFTGACLFSFVSPPSGLALAVLRPGAKGHSWYSQKRSFHPGRYDRQVRQSSSAPGTLLS